MAKISYIVVADINEIQNYVFKSSQLRAIRGASLIIESIGQVFRDLLSGTEWDVLSYQGGLMVAILSDDKTTPEQVCQKYQQQVFDVAGPTLGLVMDWIKLEDPSQYKSQAELLFKRIQYKKESSGQFIYQSTNISGGFSRPCELCKTQPAETFNQNHQQKYTYAFGPGDYRYLCRACLLKVQHGITQSSSSNNLEQRVISRLSHLGTNIYPAHDMSDLWSKATEDRFMAMITLDGNAIGQLIKKLGKEEYCQFSTALSKLFDEAIANTILSINSENPDLVFVKQDQHSSLRMLPIVSGGDDIAIWLPAETAPIFVAKMGKFFTELSQNSSIFSQPIHAAKNHAHKLTLSFGMIIAKPHFPLLNYNRIARQLRSNAKRKMVSIPDCDGAIDFALVTTPDADDITNLRTHYQVQPVSGVSYSLTQKPYTLNDYSKLLVLIKALQQLPPTHRKRIYKEMWNSKWDAESALQQCLYTRGNDKNRIGEILSSLQGTTTYFHNDSTHLVDALELADFLPEEVSI